MTRPPVDVPLVLDRRWRRPLSVQITDQVRSAVSEGRLAAGERLPSTRALGVSLGVSRTVATEAYQQLFAEGWLDARQGSGTYVADVTPVSHARPARSEAATPAPSPAFDLRPGLPWTGGIDRAAWRRAWRQAATPTPDGWPDEQGLPLLRTALADFLRRGRGVMCDPGQLVVTRGATHGLGLLAGALLAPGDRVGVEEPGYARARSVLADRGLRVVPCPVDEHGLVVDGLREDLRLVYTTPAHQYPLGGRLPVPRRQALLAWARRCVAVVAEDDYDGEFRYDVGPLPTLHELDPAAVVYLGTTAKILAPRVGVGWLVADDSVVRRVVAYREALGDITPAVPQEAVRVLVERGDVDRHVRRMRAAYARRREAVVRMFAGVGPQVRLLGDTAGLHVVLELSRELTASLVRVAAERGVAVDTLDRHYAGAPDRYGIVLGYGGLARPDLERACAELAGALTSATGPRDRAGPEAVSR